MRYYSLYGKGSHYIYMLEACLQQTMLNTYAHLPYIESRQIVEKKGERMEVSTHTLCGIWGKVREISSVYVRGF